MSPFRVTIIGAGLTGALTACRLKRKFQDNVVITLLEKSRGVGGRMSTNRCTENPLLTCDLGAQYISPSPQLYDKHKGFYEELVAAGLLKEFTGKIVGTNRFENNGEHYIAPDGMNSVVKYFLKASDSMVQYNFTVDEISKSVNDDTLAVTSKEGNKHDSSDAIIITIPVPQLLNFKGSLRDYLKPYKESLEKVEYSSRYAMALYFTNEPAIELPWTCKYLDGDECIRFISVDTAKREQGNKHGTSITVHTSVPFGIKHLEEDFNAVQPLILSSLKSILPQLPKPDAIKCQRWRYSQIYKPYHGNEKSLTLNKCPLVIAGGDSFAQSTFDGCIESSSSLVEKLSKAFSSQL